MLNKLIHAAPAHPAQTRSLGDKIRTMVWFAALSVAVWVHRHRSRRRLGELPPHLLSDIGVTGAEAAQEVRKPFWRP